MKSFISRLIVLAAFLLLPRQGLADLLPRAVSGLDLTDDQFVSAEEAENIRGEANKSWSPHGFPKGECTWYVDGRAAQKGWNLKFKKASNAYTWYDNVTNAKKNSSTGKTGDIMVLNKWSGNPYGHVLYVENAINKDNKWTVSHAKWSTSWGGSKYKTIDGVQIYKSTVTETSKQRVNFGTRSTYPLRGFLHKK